jgi:hypothetical protein
MPLVGFELTITASVRAKTVHALDLSATVTGPRLLYPPEKNTSYPLDTRLGRSGRCGEDKNVMILPKIEPRPSSS